MSTPTTSTQREFRDWSVPAVRLLQGVVYADDPRTWDILLRSRSSLESYFLRVGLLLVVDEGEGYAFVRQLEADEMTEGYDTLPKLIRKVPLGYGPTLLAVLLRDELRKFEDEDLHNERCVVDALLIFEQWKMFFPSQNDETRHVKEFYACFSKLEDLGFVRKFADDPNSWEVRRVLKARLAVRELESLKDQLLSVASERGDAATRGSADE